MIENLLDLSDKIKSPLITVCEPIAALAKEHSIQCFVIGATARDIIISEHYGIPARSATKDIDFGIQVSSWNQFEELKKGLLEGAFLGKVIRHISFTTRIRTLELMWSPMESLLPKTIPLSGHRKIQPK